MPHGFKRDEPVSEAAFRNGLFEDHGSFFTLPDIANGRVHVHLEGLDRSRQRSRCFQKSKGKCAVCRKPIDFGYFEYHHPGTCDCVDPKCPTHVEARCSQNDSDCHKHFSKGFRRKAQ